jgi:hypothetical protein
MTALHTFSLDGLANLLPDAPDSFLSNSRFFPPTHMRTQPITTTAEPARDDHPVVACFNFPDLGIPADAPASVASQAISPATDVAVAPPSPRNRRGTADYFRPRDLALRWGVCVDKVLNFIRSGELRAFNVAAKNSRRPRYRIPVESVRQFEEQTRAAAVPEAPVATAPARRRKRAPATPARRTYF